MDEKNSQKCCSCKQQNFGHKTLIDDASKHESEDTDIVWGTCYKISFENSEKVLKDLDYRELVAGYQKTTVKVFVSDTIAVCQNAIVYYYDPFKEREHQENPFCGPENVCCSSKHIAKSFGFSGPNRDYLYRLQEYLPVSDHYVDTLVRYVRFLESHYPMNGSVFHILRVEKEKGWIYIDQGATSALSQRCKNLLSCGIRRVSGEFERDDIVSVLDCVTKKVIAKGFSNFNSKEIGKIQGKNQRTLKIELKSMNLEHHHHPTEVISKSRMILL